MVGTFLSAKFPQEIPLRKPFLCIPLVGKTSVTSVCVHLYIGGMSLIVPFFGWGTNRKTEGSARTKTHPHISIYIYIYLYVYTLYMVITLGLTTSRDRNPFVATDFAQPCFGVNHLARVELGLRTSGDPSLQLQLVFRALHQNDRLV